MLAIIGGTGLDQMPGLEIDDQQFVQTPFGSPSAPVAKGRLHGQSVIFLPRHGSDHQVPPHAINYRANLWALKEAGAGQVIGIAAVGGIHPDMPPGALVIPDQIIDYTWGRAHTFFDGEHQGVEHIEFAEPYCEDLRQRLIQAAQAAKVEIVPTGCYGATQGPRLETIAEIRRLKQDGADLVGMTGMPETALARELGLCYACCAMVANWAAGLDEQPITMSEIKRQLASCLTSVMTLVGHLDIS
jgi:5'-deoxy-5'-methylthioadenosine phosphorylase